MCILSKNVRVLVNIFASFRNISWEKFKLLGSVQIDEKQSGKLSIFEEPTFLELSLYYTRTFDFWVVGLIRLRKMILFKHCHCKREQNDLKSGLVNACVNWNKEINHGYNFMLLNFFFPTAGIMFSLLVWWTSNN